VGQYHGGLGGWGDSLILSDQSYKEVIARYVARNTQTSGDFGQYVAIGLVNEDREIVAGAVFNGYSKPNILMHIAAERVTPGFISALMHYAFIQADCKRITGLIHKKNKASRKFAEKLGARLEGTMREAAPNDDVCVYGLMKSQGLKWIRREHGR